LRSKLAAEHIILVSSMDKPGDRVMRFVRRPEVTGTMIALGCLACVALLRGQ
jgi:hypothetical protein